MVFRELGSAQGVQRTDRRAGGGVKLRYWTEVQAGGGGVTVAIWNHELHEQPIDTDATVHAPSKIDGYQINTRGYPDPL